MIHPNQNCSSIEIAGVRINRYSRKGSLEEVVGRSRQMSVRIYFVNAHCINVAQRDNAYLIALRSAEFVFNDGVGIEIAATLLGNPVIENLNGTDWTPALLDILNIQRAGKRVFLLGGREKVLQDARNLFAQRWPNLDLVGSHPGYFEDPEPILNYLCARRPDILICVMGVPKQEKFINDHWQKLSASGVTVAIAAGAVLDFLTGNVPRAPIWMQRLRMEWLFRLAIEPKRMWKRYLIGNWQFMYLVIKQFLSQRWAR